MDDQIGREHVQQFAQLDQIFESAGCVRHLGLLLSARWTAAHWSQTMYRSAASRPMYAFLLKELLFLHHKACMHVEVLAEHASEDRRTSYCLRAQEPIL